MTPPAAATRSPSATAVARLLAVLVALVMVASACGGSDDDDTLGSGAGDATEFDADADSTGDDDPTGADPTTSTTADADQDESDDEDDADEDEDNTAGQSEVDPTAWVGRYLWEEAVEGDPGSNQVLVHELVLRAPATDGDPVTGTLTQDGFQTATELAVTTTPVADGLAVEVVSVDGGLTPMEPGDVALTLIGEPADPVTVIGTLIPLVVERPTSGRYFVPVGAGGDSGGSGDGAGVGEPATFWAVEARTFDLIEVDAGTGAEVGRIGGWGAPPDGDPNQVLQALQRVDVSPDGWLWVDDCCEQAFGNVFGLDPTRVTDLEQVFGSVDGPQGRQLTGLNPVTSPDGARLAWGNGPFEVTVADGRAAPVGSVLAGDEQTFAIPVAWLDATTLAAAVAGEAETTITFWDLTSPSSPRQVGSAQVVPGSVVDAARGTDGTILVIVGPQPFTDPSRSGFIVGPDRNDGTEVPDGIASIDRDPSGQHLLWVGDDGLARVGPLGADGRVLSGIEVLWASW
ncbi:MAG: hypothetical protein AAFO29_04175 [Actinomycetota bacterium]